MGYTKRPKWKNKFKHFTNIAKLWKMNGAPMNVFLKNIHTITKKMKKNQIVINIFSPHMGRKLLVGHWIFFYGHETKKISNLKEQTTSSGQPMFFSWMNHLKLIYSFVESCITTQYLNQGIQIRILFNLILGFGFDKRFLNLNNYWVKNSQFWKGLW